MQIAFFSATTSIPPYGTGAGSGRLGIRRRRRRRRSPFCQRRHHPWRRHDVDLFLNTEVPAPRWALSHPVHGPTGGVKNLARHIVYFEKYTFIYCRSKQNGLRNASVCHRSSGELPLEEP